MPDFRVKKEKIENCGKKLTLTRKFDIITYGLCGWMYTTVLSDPQEGNVEGRENCVEIRINRVEK